MPAAKKSKATAPKPIVYITQDSGVLVGPKRAFQVGDKLKIPKRKIGWPHNITREGFDGVVARVDSDGLARVVPQETSS